MFSSNVRAGSLILRRVRMFGGSGRADLHCPGKRVVMSENQRATQFGLEAVFSPLKMPAGFAQMAEYILAQARRAMEAAKSASDTAACNAQDIYGATSRAWFEMGGRMLGASQASFDNAFDLAAKLVGAKSMSDVVEATTSHMRQQLEATAGQTEELTGIVQRLATRA